MKDDLFYEYCDPFDTKYNYFMRVEHLGRYLYVKNNINKDSNLLDVACSNGYGTKFLSNYVKKIVGIDKNVNYIKIAKEKNNNKNIFYKVLNLDYEEMNGEYDFIVCFETLEHVEFPDLLLKKLYKVLSDNGRLFLSVPNSKYEIIENGNNKDIYHLHVFQYEQLLDMFKENNFKVLKVLGQSKTNKIVNGLDTNYVKSDLVNDAKTIGYPDLDEIEKSYSYMFVLCKEGE